MKKIAVFQHVEWEGPGRYLLQAARQYDLDLHIYKMWEQPIIAELYSYDGLIILGGGPNVDEEDTYPFLIQEKIAIRAWLELDRPCLGICLGHQLLAQALGAKVGANFCKSVGFASGHLTHNGRQHPVFDGLPSTFPLFKWHGMAVLPPVPRHFHILATSSQCQVEAFTVKQRPYLVGVQYDNHAAHPDDVKAWLQHDEPWLSSLTELEIDNQAMLAEASRLQADMEQQFLRFCENMWG